MKIILLFLGIAGASLGLLILFLFRPLAHSPQPADFNCLSTDSSDGEMISLKLIPVHIYGIGLSYKKHIEETSSNFDPMLAPPVFIKHTRSLNQTSETVKIPSREEAMSMLEGLEQGLGKRVDLEYKDFPLLIDYEVEMAFVLLEDVNWREFFKNNDYMPKLGFFLANDISSRALAILGEGMENRYDYWGASKSFPGFLPVSSHMWVPNKLKAGSTVCTMLTTKINGEIRQNQSTMDQIYTPRQLIRFIAEKYPEELPQKGDIVLTGTPGGVAMHIPVWKVRLGELLSLDRFKKLKSSIRSNKNNKRFLKPGDVIEMSGGILGSIRTTVVESKG